MRVESESMVAGAGERRNDFLGDWEEDSGNRWMRAMGSSKVATVAESALM